MCKLRILFLLKKNYTSAGENAGVSDSGLLNSVTFLADGLKTNLDVCTDIIVCQDANSIDKAIHDNKPDIAVLEALWYTPTKLLELQKLWPGVLFLVRINSKIPFLSQEGMSIGWIKEYIANSEAAKLTNLTVSTNNQFCTNDLQSVGIRNVYLPNLYPYVESPVEGFVNKISEEARFTLNLPVGHAKKTIDIGCFGAIRPLKNQLIQAFAAMTFADEHKLELNFHINSGRVEQQGGEPLKNIRSLFKDSGHTLIEHGWLSHDTFLALLAQMDICLQVSYTESFNIVTADTISQRVPVVVSHDIDWAPDVCKADPNNMSGIADKIGSVLGHKPFVVRKSIEALNEYTRKAVKEWWNFLYPIEFNG